MSKSRLRRCPICRHKRVAILAGIRICSICGRVGVHLRDLRDLDRSHIKPTHSRD